MQRWSRGCKSSARVTGEQSDNTQEVVTAALAGQNSAAQSPWLIPDAAVICRAHHDVLTVAVQQAAAQSSEAGCLLVAADALQQRVAELIEQVACVQDVNLWAVLADSVTHPSNACV